MRVGISRHMVTLHARLFRGSSTPPLNQLFDAMDYIHNERNIIHCDIKPENILLSHGLLPTPGSTSAMGECLPPAPVVAVPAGAIFAARTPTCLPPRLVIPRAWVVMSCLHCTPLRDRAPHTHVVFGKPNRSSFPFTFMWGCSAAQAPLWLHYRQSLDVFVVEHDLMDVIYVFLRSSGPRHRPHQALHHRLGWPAVRGQDMRLWERTAGQGCEVRVFF
jgi:hypothetical protein